MCPIRPWSDLDIATDTRSTQVEPEHVLLALAREQKWLLARFLPQGLEALDSMVRRAGEGTGAGQEAPSHFNGTYSPAVIRILSYAQEEADALHQAAIDVEHLLLGLMREPETLACRLLREHGVDPERIRSEIRNQPNRDAES